MIENGRFSNVCRVRFRPDLMCCGHNKNGLGGASILDASGSKR